MSRSRPFLAPALALTVGVAVGLHGVAFPPALAAALTLGASPPLAPGAFAVAGWWTAQRTLLPAAPAAHSAEVQPLVGRIASVPERLGDRVRFRLRTPEGRAL